mgnify:CR=1 FL=1
MKITVIDAKPEEDDEIIVKCHYLDENLSRLLQQLKNGSSMMNFYKQNKIIPIEKSEIIFFESVDDKCFAYTADDVYETKLKLYEIEELMPEPSFFRANKAVIVNLRKIKNLLPALGGRFEATLANGYKAIISRNYVPKLKMLLGL